MIEKAKEAYRVTHNFHETTYSTLQDLIDAIRSTSDVKELADLAFALREISKLADDIRKVANAAKETAEKICCAIAIRDGDCDTIRTKYVTATPNVKMMADLPRRKREPERWRELMIGLGVPEDALDGERPVVDVNWKGFVDHISDLAEQGKPLPPGIDPGKTYPVYELSPMTKKKGSSLL